MARKQRGPGRPKTTGTGTAITVRCRSDFLKRVDRWRAKQPDLPTRPRAIVRLAELALKNERS